MIIVPKNEKVLTKTLAQLKCTLSVVSQSVIHSSITNELTILNGRARSKTVVIGSTVLQICGFVSCHCHNTFHLESFMGYYRDCNDCVGRCCYV